MQFRWLKQDDGVLVSTRSLRKRSLFILGSGMLAAALALGSGTAAWAAPAPPPETDGLEYVALGDSYAAGLGLPPSVGTPDGCYRSSSNYPHQIAAILGLDLTDVTCSGADTSNIIDTPQDTGTGLGINPVQSEALSEDTDIVTVTIGGNDLAFAEIIYACLASDPNGPLVFGPDQNCESKFSASGTDILSARIAGEVSDRLTATLTKIRTEAPDAKIFVVGYLALMPDPTNTPIGGCFTSLDLTGSSFPFTDVDVAYLHGIQKKLDDAMHSAATAAGATFVPLFENSLDRTACADNPDSYIVGASVSPASMHPNADDANFMASSLEEPIRAAFAVAPVITSGAPTASTLVGESYSFNVTASGVPQPTFSVSAGQLPDNVTLDGTTGEISGTPTTAGTFTFSITATNTVDSVTEEYSISVNQAPVITSITPPSNGTVGDDLSFNVTASGFPVPVFALASGALPDGVEFNPATGEISGTPTTAGTFTFSISATNSAGAVTSEVYSITIEAAASQTTSTDPTVPALVNTGADSLLPIGLAGALTLLVGATVLLTRRRAA